MNKQDLFLIVMGAIGVLSITTLAFLLLYMTGVLVNVWMGF